ncbi:MAG TPA: S8 family serine peptidase [Gemmatirosa sp.]|nr:S8 family serine peptidase [Gemmatirosa sp.]
MARRHAAFAALALGSLAACSSDSIAPTAPNAVSPSVRNVGVEDAAQHLVVFETQAIPADFADRVAALGGTVAARFDQIGVAAVAGLTSAAATELRAAAGVTHLAADPVLSLDPLGGSLEAEAVESDVGQSPAAPNTATFFPRQWHLRAIGAEKAWAAGKLGSSDVKVFILDTGLDYTHADLRGRVDLNLSRSFIPGDDAFLAANFPGAHPVADLHYHGTHVGATVSSNAVAAAGVTSKVTLVGVKVLSRTGSSVGSSVISGMMYAADADADVVNMSLGGAFSKDGNEAFVEAANRATSYLFDKGTLTVVSAGNSAIDLDHDGNSFKSYCSASNVVCVSATGPTAQAGTNGPWTNTDALASYSNFGVSAISVAAPGGNGVSRVTAACSMFSLAVPVCRTGTYVIGINGTSMASPHVSGLAALLVEQVGRNKPAQLRAALAKSVDDLGKRGRDPIYGAGRINVATGLGL